MCMANDDQARLPTTSQFLRLGLPSHLGPRATGERQDQDIAQDLVLTLGTIILAAVSAKEQATDNNEWISTGRICRTTSHLTRTERRLLTYLVRYGGRIVSHGELSEAMSSGNPSENIGNLRPYISRLRKKIEIDPALPRVITTHRDLGYSFAGEEDARWFPDLEW